MDTSQLSLKLQPTLEMYALKASPGYLAYTLKILDLYTNHLNEDSLGQTEMRGQR